MTILPFRSTTFCPKCEEEILIWKWHQDGSCPPVVLLEQTPFGDVRTPPAHPEHLHGICRCNFSVMTETADAKKE